MVAIFVLATIITCILIEMALDRFARRKHATAMEPPVPALVDRFVIPRNYFLSRSHAWAELLFTGHVRIGVDDFVQKLVGNVDAVVVPRMNAEIKKGETLFTIHQGERTLSFPSPFSGSVVEVNSTLRTAPATIKNDPYVSGWVVLIAPTGLAAELKLLNVAEEAVQWLRDEVRRFRNFIKEQAAGYGYEGKLAMAGTTMLDGGMPLAGVLEHANEQTWKAFEQSFLAEGSGGTTV